jgi:ABC-type transport system substrate-binding protein
MEVRRENARRLLAEYEAEKGEIDWSKIPIVCASNLTWSCAHALIMKQSLEKIGIDVELQPGDVTQVRGGEVAGDWELSTIGAWMDFDDPVDTCNTLYVTNGGRWYQRSSIPELDDICEQLTFEADFEKRRMLAWEMDKLAMNDSAWVILFWSQWNGLHWDYVKGFVYSSVKGTSNPRMKYVWLTCDAPTAGC